MAPRISEPLLVAFGAAVREARQRRGLSQDALAVAAEFERTYVTEIETGKRNVTLLNIGRLASALGVGVGELMTSAQGHFAAGQSQDHEARD
jgi:transcriptional regulator with XRE-family HTH domain